MHTVRWSNRAAMALLVAVGVSACHTMRPLEKSQLAANPDLQRIWVTRTDKSTVMVERPEVIGDTLDGTVYGKRQRIPLSDVTTVQERVSAPSKTRNLVLAIAVVGAGATVALLNQNSNQENKNGLCYVAADQPPVNCCLVQVSNGGNPPNC